MELLWKFAAVIGVLSIVPPTSSSVGQRRGYFARPGRAAKTTPPAASTTENPAVNASAPANQTTVQAPGQVNLSLSNQGPPVGKLPLSMTAEPDSPDKIRVSLTIFPIYLESVDVRLGICHLRLYLVKEWYDGRLAWDAKLHGMPGGLKLPQRQIWTPDIEPYNSLLSPAAPEAESTALVMPNGTVRQVRSYRLKTPVRRSQGFFLPACEVRLATWTSRRLKLVSDKVIDLSRLLASGQWEFRKEFTKILYTSGFLEVRSTIVFSIRSQAYPSR